MDIKQGARVALDRAGLMGLYFKLVEWRIARGKEQPPATDENSVPIPPLELMARVVAHADWRAFLKTGEATAKALDDHARGAGLGFTDAHRILDFGCGSGRVIRHLPQMTKASLFGVDYNSSLVDWCAANLPGTYRQNQLHPPLDFSDDQFDIAYLLSVFTHLRIPTQREWLAELARVIRPGGLAMISFHDEVQPRFPDGDAARAALAEHGYYISKDLAEGSNLIASFQTQAFTEQVFGEYFDVVKIMSRDESRVGQALAVLKKRP